MTVKLTKADFEYFQKWCKFYIKKLNLLNWEVFYDFIKIKENFAQVITDRTGKVAQIELSSIWCDIAKLHPYKNKREKIKGSAIHECLEILLSDLEDLAKAKQFDEDAWCSEKHSIIRILEKLLV
jgi:hypothetical protein